LLLPPDFKLHESRLSRDSREVIEFQFDRLALKSSDPQIFLEKFLRISQSPTLSPDDSEVFYLASKVAYMLSNYAYFETVNYKENGLVNDGAKIWQALTNAARGHIEDAIHTLEDVKDRINITKDQLQYIECLGILAQLYFIRGSYDKPKLNEIMDELNQFKEKNQDLLPDFNHMYMPVYLIENRIKSQQLPLKEIIEEAKKLHEISKETNDHYWIVQFQLDLAQAYIHSKDITSASKLLEDVFNILQKMKFAALEAKAKRIQGKLYETSNRYELAEKTYLVAKTSYSKLEDQIGVITCINELAQLSLLQDQNNKAEKYYSEAFDLSREMNDFTGMATSLSALAKLSYRSANYKESLKQYSEVLEIALNNSFEYFLPDIYDGLACVNFITGDFWSALEYRMKTVEFKEKFAFSDFNLLLEHMKLGQLHALVANFEQAFEEFEKALNYSIKLNKKDDVYFDILNWLFEISTALGNMSLAATYMGRADLFASIHDSEEENAQALISRIRFLIQKKELDAVKTQLDVVFEKAQEFPSALTTALALIEKAAFSLLKYQEERESERIDEALQAVEDMLFISMDLEFLPLTMYSKKVTARILSFQGNYNEAKDEINEAKDLGQELGLNKFVDLLTEDCEKIESLQKDSESLSEDELNKRKEECLDQALNYLRETFWLVSSSEHQTI